MRTIIATFALATAILACAGCGGAASTGTDDGSGAGMNLRITSASLTSSPGLPVMNGAVVISVLVANNGTVATPATTYSYSFGDSTVSGLVLPAVPAGSTTTVQCSVTSTAAGTFPVTVTLDAGHLVNERSESDNAVTVNITWTAASVRNIAVSHVTASPTSPTAGGSVSVDFDLTYDGTSFPVGGGVSRSVEWRVVRKDDTTDVLASGRATFYAASASVHTSITEDASGAEVYVLQTDYDHLVSESLESDNDVEFNVTWMTPSASG